MTDGINAPAGSGSAWGQAFTAVVLVGGLAAGLWTFQQASMSAAPRPAACSAGKPEQTSGRLSGEQLCTALNRPDLADLLGIPGQIAKSASGGGGSIKSAEGTETPTPSARVEFETYTVSLTANYDRLQVTGLGSLLGDTVRQRTVLGRPAVVYSDRTIRLSFRLDGKDSSSAPGVPARTLMVARDAQDSGGSFTVTLWRADGAVPDDAALRHVAETVLPTIPGWSAQT
jgi:hypothetical protein